MPRQNIDYNKSVIYKIEHEDKPNLLYVGSTTDFTRRKNLHKSNCNNNLSINYDTKLYRMIRANGGWDSFTIMIIKELNCNSKVEMLIEEDKMMKELKSTLNTIRANLTDDETKEYHTAYNQSEKGKARKKTYNQSEKGKATLNAYNQSDEGKAIKKSYAQSDEGKVIAALNKSTIIDCICGCKITKTNKLRHKQSKKHLRFLQYNSDVLDV